MRKIDLGENDFQISGNDLNRFAINNRKDCAKRFVTGNQSIDRFAQGNDIKFTAQSRRARDIIKRRVRC